MRLHAFSFLCVSMQAPVFFCTSKPPAVLFLCAFFLMYESLYGIFEQSIEKRSSKSLTLIIFCDNHTVWELIITINHTLPTRVCLGEPV